MRIESYYKNEIVILRERVVDTLEGGCTKYFSSPHHHKFEDFEKIVQGTVYSEERTAQTRRKWPLLWRRKGLVISFHFHENIVTFSRQILTLFF